MSANPATVFVAMPFRAKFDGIYTKVIRPAIVDSGNTPIRADGIFSAGEVLAQIAEGIANSSLVVAEVSELNANVYYELGLAHSMRKPTLLVSHSTETVPFDLRPLRCITYSVDNPEWGAVLRADLQRGIAETLDSPVAAVPLGVLKALDGMSDSGQGAASSPTSEEGSTIALLLDRIARLTNVVNSMQTPKTMPEADLSRMANRAAVRETAEQMLAAGVGEEDIIEALVANGSSTLLAEYVIRKLLEDGSDG